MDWLIDWLIDWSNDWWMDGSIDWLIDCSLLQFPSFLVMDGTLPSSLKHIISNAEYYGSSLFLLATDIVTVYVFHEPAMLTSLQDRGLTDVILQAVLVKDVRFSLLFSRKVIFLSFRKIFDFFLAFFFCTLAAADQGSALGHPQHLQCPVLECPRFAGVCGL